MLFSSLIFLGLFFPLVLILYHLCKNLAWKNGCLIAASLLFYSYGEPLYIVLMLASVFFNFLFGKELAKEQEKESKEPEKFSREKRILILAVVFNLGLLFVFKYLDMALTLINWLLSTRFVPLSLPLPVGISFFTFQALSYVIDVYRKEVRATDKLWVLMLYISYFPQLIAGPIVKYKDMEVQILKRSTNSIKEADGMVRFIIGLSKTVLIAGTLAGVVDTLFALPLHLINIFSAWLGAICYLFEIYFAFSGYCDMAIGLGQMFGFKIRENFNYPYISSSIKEFWQRWNISLSSWFHDYLYIPLGGKRKGKVRAALNKMLVFTLIGLWHGARLTFLCWGWWNGLFLLLEEHVRIDKIPLWIRHIMTMLIVLIGFVLFRTVDLRQGFVWIEKMFTGFEMESIQMAVFSGQLSLQVILTLILACFFAVPFKAIEKIQQHDLIKYGLSFLLLVLSFFALVSSSINSFITIRL